MQVATPKHSPSSCRTCRYVRVRNLRSWFTLARVEDGKQFPTKESGHECTHPNRWHRDRCSAGRVIGLIPATAANAYPSNSAIPAAAAAAQPANTTLPVTGTLPDGTAFTGSLSNLSTSVVDGAIQLSGTITGTGLPAGGTTFTAPVQNLDANSACDVLNLDLGPLDLNLLGLQVDLAPVVLDITAVPGAGICWATCCAPLPDC